MGLETLILAMAIVKIVHMLCVSRKNSVQDGKEGAQWGFFGSLGAFPAEARWPLLSQDTSHLLLLVLIHSFHMREDRQSSATPFPHLEEAD
jgi:hypothetical protein